MGLHLLNLRHRIWSRRDLAAGDEVRVRDYLRIRRNDAGQHPVQDGGRLEDAENQLTCGSDWVVQRRNHPDLTACSRKH